MASISRSLPFEAQNDGVSGPGEFGRELARLHERFAMLEEIDSQTTEMLSRLAEARAIASLEISTSIARFERLVAEWESRQRSLLIGMLDEVAAAQSRANNLAHIATQLETSFNDLQVQLSAQVAGTGSEQAATLHIVPPTPAAPSTALPLTTTFVEIEGVPTVTLALSLQRFVAGLPGVVSALTREYAADVVRFEVQVMGRITSDDVVEQSQGGLRTLERDSVGLHFVLFDQFVFTPQP